MNPDDLEGIEQDEEQQRLDDGVPIVDDSSVGDLPQDVEVPEEIGDPSEDGVPIIEEDSVGGDLVNSGSATDGGGDLDFAPDTEEGEESGDLDPALGGALIAGAALMATAAAGEMNQAAADREAKRKQMEEARLAREREREERERERQEKNRQRLEEGQQKIQERSNRPSFAQELSETAPPPTRERTFRAPPPTGGNEPVSETAAEGDAVAEVAPTAPAQPKPDRPARPERPAKAGEDGSTTPKDPVRAEREAERIRQRDEKKAAAEAKKAERAAAIEARAAQRQASIGAVEHVERQSRSSDWDELREGGVDTAALMEQRMAGKADRFSALAQRGASEANAFLSRFNEAKAGRASMGAAPTPVASVASAAPGTAANDYLDILQHLEARATVHSEYGEVRDKFEPRLLAGGEIVSCSLVGLNAGLLNTVHRKLSDIQGFFSRVEWKGVALEPVLVVSERGSRREFRIDPYATDPDTGELKPVTLGRGPENTVQLSTEFVSRNHLKIYNTVKDRGLPPQWEIEDCGSTHGTYVNGSQIRNRRGISPIDDIELGRNYASVEYPSIKLVYRAIPYGREDLSRMIVEVDLVIAVVEADREFDGQVALLKNLSDAQKLGGLLVMAVSTSGPIDESMEINIDELRHAARILKGTEQTRYLAAISKDDFQEEVDWLEGVCGFIENFRAQVQGNVHSKQKQINRQEMVAAILDTGARLESRLARELDDAEINLQRVGDEISSAPRNLGAAENLRDDTFRTLKQTLEDDTNFFGDPLRPDSLTYYVEKLVDQCVLSKEGKTSVTLSLLDPISHQPPHRWIIGELSRNAIYHFDQLTSTLTGPQRDPHGIGGLYQNLRELLGGHDKLRNTDLFVDENYNRVALSELTRQLHTTLSVDFVQNQAKTSTKIDNIVGYVITKMRFAVMFYMSMFSIVGVVAGMNRSAVQKAFSGSMKESGIWYVLAVAALITVCVVVTLQYKANVRESIEEVVDKMKVEMKKHYQAIAKKLVDDAKRVFTIHLSTQETKIKQEMSTLGSSRVSDSMMTRNNPLLDQAKKERDDLQTMIYAIGQERSWAESAVKQYTQSPFVQVQPVRRTTTTRTTT